MGLKDPLSLPYSSSWDIPLCACIVDIDFDGKNEILIGTYGQVRKLMNNFKNSYKILNDYQT